MQSTTKKKMVCAPAIRNSSQFDVNCSFNFVHSARNLPNLENPNSRKPLFYRKDVSIMFLISAFFLFNFVLRCTVPYHTPLSCHVIKFFLTY